MIYFKKIDSDDELIFLNTVRNDCAVEFLHDSTIYTIEDTKKWYSTLQLSYYMVYLDKQKVGYFRISNYSFKNKNLYIGMDLHKEYRGQGLAFEAYRLFIPYVFNYYELNKISLEVLSTNEVAYNLYKKLGFIDEGVKRQEVLKNGIYVDSIIMSMLRSELLTNKKI